MPASTRRIAQIAVVGLIASLAIVFAQPAVARMAPETLADRRPVQAGPVDPAFPVDYVGVLWDTDHPHDTESHGAVRFRHDGQWGSWIRLIDDGIEAEGQWASGLVAGGDADAYQVRGIPGHAEDPQVVAINTTDGPLVQVGETRGGAAQALASTRCRSRADWGADESLRLDSSGNEVWPAEHYPVQALTVHHTATRNNDPDPEATVRAIYRYHAVDQGWGDIGYQYLIDESGVVHEGRWSGAPSTSCETGGGDGSDFGHETPTDLDGDRRTDEMVTAAHVGGSNSGNMGVALLGEFTDHPNRGGHPAAAAVDSLEDVLAELGVRHDLDPTGTVDYVNPVTGARKNVATISGHRDWVATECPGARLYERLPTIRERVAEKMASGGDSDAPPSVTLTNPADATIVSGTVTVAADASDDAGVAQVELFVDGTSLAVDTDGSNGWSALWDTTTASEGSHTVSATATDTAGQTASHSVSVTVDNDDGSGDGGGGDATTLHVGDLDGTAEANKNEFRAIVTIRVVDGAGAPVAGATVGGSWSPTGGAASCTTESDGTCEVISPWVHKRQETFTFTVSSVTHGSLTYDSAANTDPDGDSDGTSITVRKVG